MLSFCYAEVLTPSSTAANMTSAPASALDVLDCEAPCGGHVSKLFQDKLTTPESPLPAGFKLPGVKEGLDVITDLLGSSLENFATAATCTALVHDGADITGATLSLAPSFYRSSCPNVLTRYK